MSLCWRIQNMLFRLQDLIEACHKQNMILCDLQNWWHTPHIGIPLPPCKKGDSLKMFDNVQLDKTLIKKATATYMTHNVIKVKNTKPGATLNKICLKRGAGWY